MCCAIDGRFVIVRETSGRLVRKFSMNTNVIGAQVRGDNVIIQCEGGWTYVYKTSGMIVRKTKNYHCCRRQCPVGLAADE